MPDKEEIIDLIGVEIDLQNLRTCILSLLRGYSSDFVESFLLESPHGISRKFLLRLFKERNPHIFIEHFLKYESFLRPAITGEDWGMESELLRILKKKIDSKRIPKYISFFYVIRYVSELEIEYRNLRSLALAVYHGIPAERRKRLLVL